MSWLIKVISNIYSLYTSEGRRLGCILGTQTVLGYHAIRYPAAAQILNGQRPTPHPVLYRVGAGIVPL